MTSHISCRHRQLHCYKQGSVFSVKSDKTRKALASKNIPDLNLSERLQIWGQLVLKSRSIFVPSWDAASSFVALSSFACRRHGRIYFASYQEHTQFHVCSFVLQNWASNDCPQRVPWLRRLPWLKRDNSYTRRRFMATEPRLWARTHIRSHVGWTVQSWPLVCVALVSLPLKVVPEYSLLYDLLIKLRLL